MKILVVKCDNGGCWLYRSCYQHAHMVNHLGADIYFVGINDLERDDTFDFGKYDIVHIHQQVNGAAPIYEMVKASGAKLVVDVDDYWVIPSSHHLYNSSIVNHWTENCLHGMRVADLVTTTTQYLADKIVTINRNVVVLPNCINMDDRQWNAIRHYNPKVRVGYVGGITHENDLQMLSGIVQYLRGSYIQFRLCGFDLRGAYTRAQVEANPWVKIERSLTCNYSAVTDDYADWLRRYIKGDYPYNEDYIRVPTKDIMSYASNYADIDIVVAPLADSEFNRCKSELKILEASAYGLPVIASNVHPFDNIVNESNAVLMPKKSNPRDWARAIKMLATDEERRKRLATKLHEDVNEKYNIDTIARKRLEIYKHLIDGREYRNI